jgi:hypothetical protein
MDGAFRVSLAVRYYFHYLTSYLSAIFYQAHIIFFPPAAVLSVPRFSSRAVAILIRQLDKNIGPLPMNAPDILTGVPPPGGHSRSIRGTHNRNRPRRGRGDILPRSRRELNALPASRQEPAVPHSHLDSQSASGVPERAAVHASGGRGGRRGTRGGTRASVVGPSPRLFGGRLTVTSAPSTVLQADAPEFRPGQAIVQRRSVPYRPDSITRAD